MDAVMTKTKNHGANALNVEASSCRKKNACICRNIIKLEERRDERDLSVRTRDG